MPGIDSYDTTACEGVSRNGCVRSEALHWISYPRNYNIVKLCTGALVTPKSSFGPSVERELFLDRNYFFASSNEVNINSVVLSSSYTVSDLQYLRYFPPSEAKKIVFPFI